MMSIDVIVTRYDEPSSCSEWENLWGFQPKEYCKAYGDDSDVGTDWNAASLIVLNGSEDSLIDDIGKYFREQILPHFFPWE